MPIRKHKGINQKTGKLKKGFKYSGKKLKSGLPVIIKIQKGGNSNPVEKKPFLPPVPVFKILQTNSLLNPPKITRSLLSPPKIQDPIKKIYTQEFNKQRRKKLSEIDKLTYVEDLNKKLLKGGAILGQGGFGCVISPSLICKKGEKSSNDKISKLMNDKDAFIEETENVEIMKSVDPDMKYFLYPISFCEFDQKLNNKSFLGCFSCGNNRDVETCKAKMGIDGEENYVLYNVVQPFGGKDLYKAVENSITRQLFTKNFDYYKEYLTKGINSMHKKGIIHRDIKPENIVLNKKGEIRYIDIGFVHKIKDSDFKTENGLHELLGASPILFRPLEMDMMEFWLSHKKYRTIHWSEFFKEWQKRRPAKYNEDVKSIIQFNNWNYQSISGLQNLFNKLSVKFIGKYMKDNIYKWDIYSLQLAFNEMAQMLTPKATDNTVTI